MSRDLRRFPGDDDVTYHDEYRDFESMSESERENLVRRTARRVFEEEMSRETTREMISQTAEAVFRKIDVENIIKSTAVEVSKEMIKEAFRLLDIDPTNREETRRFREDMKFLRWMNSIRGDIITKAIGVIGLAIIVSGVYSAWDSYINRVTSAPAATQSAK